MMRKLFALVPVLVAVGLLAGCASKPPYEEPTQTISKKGPQPLSYENMSLLLEDMERYAKTLKPLNLEAAQKVNDRYVGVTFYTEQAPLFVNVYPDQANSRVVFLIFPKDPRTGSTFLLQYDKKLPVVNESTLELQIRTRDPESPLTCLLDQKDPQAYIDEVRSHLFTVRFTMVKRFMQSGTFDFDGLSITSYRQRGYPFVVFDLLETKLTDNTAKVSCSCRQE